MIVIRVEETKAHSMKQTYKIFKVGKQAVSGVLEAGQYRYFGIALSTFILTNLSASGSQA